MSLIMQAFIDYYIVSSASNYEIRQANWTLLVDRLYFSNVIRKLYTIA
jgi:hypothetical protein